MPDELPAPIPGATVVPLAPAPAGSVVHDGHETVAHRWIPPAEAVACRERGEIAVVAPTRVTLHTLAQATTVADTGWQVERT
jgi:hypothetical protein